MASDFDELIERLLFDVALSGSEGIGAQQLEKAVRTFHCEQEVAELASDEPVNLLFSDLPSTLAPEADEDFILLALEWLCKHPDIEIRSPAVFKGQPSVAASSQAVESSSVPTGSSTSIEDKLQGKRLFATRDRVWRAITGHGVDNHRVPAKEFECLTAIAASGSSGILQPQLCRETGQDKRSVPKRTDGLAQKGYINKEIVINNKCKTSLLTLKRFVKGSSSTAPERPMSSVAEASSGQIIFYDTWYSETMRLIKENGNVISMDDLRMGLGISKKKWEGRILIRCLRRLDDGGLLRRFSGILQSREGGTVKRISTGKDKRVTAVELLREPTSMDHVLWTQSIHRMQKGKLLSAKDKADARAVADEADPTEDGYASDSEEDANDDSDSIKQRVPPQWIMDIPYPNLLFRVVQQAGPAGVSSMALNRFATGPVWRRPLDEIMGKLTDAWRFSQPPHLRHFTLVRDTAVHWKAAHYQYRTIDNYRHAIEAGDASWAAIGGDPSDSKNTPVKQRWTELAMDEWGLPKPQLKDLATGDGKATLADAMKPAYVKNQGRRPQQGWDVVPSGDAAPKKKGTNKRKAEGSSTVAKKRRKVLEKERKEFDAFAQGVAERQVLITAKKTLPSNSSRSITVKELPIDKVQELKAAIVARDQPGLYINPPGSRAVKLDNFYHRGRPRNCLIAVIKSEKLHSLPWFKGEQDNVVASEAVAPRRSAKRKKPPAPVQSPSDSPAPHKPSSSVAEPPPKKQRRMRKHAGSISKEAGLLEAEFTRRPTEGVLRSSDEDPNTRTTNMVETISAAGGKASDSRLRHDSELAHQSTLLTNAINDAAVSEHQNTTSGHSLPIVNTLPPEVYPNPMAVDQPELSAATEIVAEPSKISSQDARSRRPRKGGTPRTGGFVAEQRAKAVLDAVRLCNGVFPGNNEIWYVVTTFWKKKFGKSPDRHTVERAVNNLIANGSLKRFTFQFRTKKGLMQTRAVLTEPGITPQTQDFREMQRHIKETWPDQYLPPEAEVEEELRKQAANMYGRRRAQEPKRMEASSRPTPEFKSKQVDTNPVDVRAMIRQTDYSAELLHKSAREEGFESSQAFVLHSIQKNPTYLRSWGRQSVSELQAEVGDTSHIPIGVRRAKKAGQANVRPDGSTNRAPLSTLRLSGRGGIKKPSVIRRDGGQYLPSMLAHSQLDPQWYMSVARSKVSARVPRRRPWETIHNINLHPESLHQAEFVAMLMQPAHVFHSPTGTFGIVRPLGSAEPEIDHFGLSHQARLQDSINSQAQAKQFFRDVDHVQRWEIDMVAKNQMVDYSKQGFMFVHHIVNPQRNVVPHEPAVLPTIFEHTPYAPQGGSETQSAVAASRIVHPPKGRRGIQAKKVRISEDENALKQALLPSRKPYVKRDRHSAATFKDADRLVIALALVSVLCGGINQYRVNWNIIAHALSFRYSGEFLRRRWGHHQKFRTKDMEKLRDAIRGPFLKAYEEGRVPSVNFQSIEKTEWSILFKWVEREVMPTLNGEDKLSGPDLLSSRAELERKYDIIERSDPYEARREEFFIGISDHGRRQKLIQFRYGQILPGSLDPLEPPPQDNILIKSWVRAVAATKQRVFNPTAAAQKLGIFTNRLLTSISKSLVDDKILIRPKKGRQLPGRNFQIHNDLLVQFRRWPGRTTEHRYLRDVARARTEILSHFSSHDHLDLVPTSADPTYIVLTNMLAQGFLKISATLPARNDEFDAPFPKLSPWSYGGYSYETKKVPIKHLKFPIVFSKTEAWSTHHDLRSGIPVPLHVPPVPGEMAWGERIPFWVDIHGNLMEDVWDMCVRSVLHLLVFRPGYDAKAMEAAHKGKFGAWEIEVVLGWMEKVGVAVRCGVGGEEGGVWKGGWRAGGFWYCAFLEEVVGWKGVEG